MGIPSEEEGRAAGMDHAMLGHTGNTRALSNFAELFVVLGGGDAHLWGKDEVEPLVAYIQSLTPPPGPTVDVNSAERGRRVFWENDCGDCHQGPRGSGLTLYDFEELGTDSAMGFNWGPTNSPTKSSLRGWLDFGPWSGSYTMVVCRVLKNCSVWTGRDRHRRMMGWEIRGIPMGVKRSPYLKKWTLSPF